MLVWVNDQYHLRWSSSSSARDTYSRDRILKFSSDDSLSSENDLLIVGEDVVIDVPMFGGESDHIRAHRAWRRIKFEKKDLVRKKKRE